MGIVSRGSGDGESPTWKKRAWWRRITDRRIVAASLSAFAAIVGLIRSLIDLINRR